MRCILVLFLLHGQFSSLLLSLHNALKEILSLFTLGWPLSLRWRYNDDEVAIFGRTFYISSKKLDTRIQCWHYSDGIAKAVTNDWLKVKIDRIYRLTKTNDWPTCQDFSIETRGGFCVCLCRRATHQGEGSTCFWHKSPYIPLYQIQMRKCLQTQTWIQKQTQIKAHTQKEEIHTNKGQMMQV